MTKYPDKIKKIMKLLVAQGYFKKEQDIINIALLEYFEFKGLFDKLSEAETKKIQKELKDKIEESKKNLSK